MGAGMLIASALLRALAYFYASAATMPEPPSLWCAAFALMGWHLLPVLLSACADGAEGCAGVIV